MPGLCWLAVNSTLHYYYYDDDYGYYYYYYYHYHYYYFFFFALSIHPLAPYILYLGLVSRANVRFMEDCKRDCGRQK